MVVEKRALSVEARLGADLDVCLFFSCGLCGGERQD